MHTCTINGVADGTDEMMVNDIEPSDSSALLEPVRKLTTTKIIEDIRNFITSINNYRYVNS